MERREAGLKVKNIGAMEQRPRLEVKEAEEQDTSLKVKVDREYRQQSG